MKELDFLAIINRTLSKTAHIGDDCAYLEDLGIVVTQDSLVEGVHFSREFSTPYHMAYRAIMVNLSDIFASGAVPKYFTISLSLPKDVDSGFVEEFYSACEAASLKYDFEIIGGDITGSDKIFISMCAIGTTLDRKISSRSHAKVGDYVITTGVHGSSAAGLWLLGEKEKGKREKFCNIHLSPVPQKRLSEAIATKVKRDYAMMDTSDGLVDAVFKIAQSGGVMISLDFDKIPYDKEIEAVAQSANADFKDWILYGGEDFQLVACLSKKDLEMIDSSLYTIIGEVKEKPAEHLVEIDFGSKIEKIYDLEKTFNHFKEKDEN